ncbi:MAG: elongation factor P-like protein YeiP [Candidatus Aminicenantes bacterium RBG_13_63_10]|nr:MAG: elongation factor P-like protein YeiP [Candidatus Aminicenantes bacterium RBG_13_63_10]
MKKASDVRKGDIVKVDGEPHIVEALSVQIPAARGGATLYKVRFRNLKSKRKADRVFRGDDILAEADFERRPVDVLYGDAEGMTFMDLQDFNQFTLARRDIEEEWLYLVEGLEGVSAVVSEGRVLGLDLPSLVNMTIVETPPAVKGGSATARTKPAKVHTGLVVQVPEHLENGDVIRVDTRTGAYFSKA